MLGTVGALRRDPVKSMLGEDVDATDVSWTGLARDRRLGGGGRGPGGSGRARDARARGGPRSRRAPAPLACPAPPPRPRGGGCPPHPLAGGEARRDPRRGGRRVFARAAGGAG